MCVAGGKANSPEGLFCQCRMYVFSSAWVFLCSSFSFNPKKDISCTYGFCCLQLYPSTYALDISVCFLSRFIPTLLPCMTDKVVQGGCQGIRRKSIFTIIPNLPPERSNKFILALRLVCYHNAQINTICMVDVLTRSSMIENNLKEHVEVNLLWNTFVCKVLRKERKSIQNIFGVASHVAGRKLRHKFIIIQGKASHLLKEFCLRFNSFSRQRIISYRLGCTWIWSILCWSFIWSKILLESSAKTF